MPRNLKVLISQSLPASATRRRSGGSIGRSVLVSQLIAGLKPVLKTKVAGIEGNFNEILVKARFKEAKFHDLSQSPP